MSSSSPLPVPVPLPFISAGWAPLHASVLTLSYVGGFYLSPAIRRLPKDDARVMRSRIKVASIVTSLGWAGTGLALWKAEVDPPHWCLRLPRLLLMLGIPLPLTVPSFLQFSILPLKPGLFQYLTSHLLPALVLPLSLTMTLFAGPLYVEWLWDNLPLPTFSIPSRGAGSKGALAKARDWLFGQGSASKKGGLAKAREWLAGWWNLHGLRNFVIGPLTEEIIWRSCILSVHHFSGASKKWLIFGTPLYFGIAHLHHAWETYRSRGRNKDALVFAALQSTLQFSYTTLFGWYANFLFLRTGSIIPPLLSHTFCNIMGLPNPASAFEEFPEHKLKISLAYLIGIAGFWYGLMPLTSPDLYGGSIFWPTVPTA